MSNVIPFPVNEGARYRGLRETAARYRAFMATTGLRKARWPRSLDVPSGFDHTNAWRDRAGRIVITTEPYHKTAAHFAGLAEQGWMLADAPCEGMWNPPDARLILVSPPRRGGDLALVIAALRAAS